MRIKKVQLHDFKRFDDLTIDLGDKPKKVIALVGPNGCGKSSVFDGFLFIQNSYDAIGAFGRKDPLFYSKNAQVNFLENFKDKVKIEFNNGSFEPVFMQKRTNKLHKTIFNYRSPYRVSQQLNIHSLAKQPSIELNSIGASQSVDLDEKIVQNYQRLYIYYEHYRKEHDLTDKQAITKVLNQLNSILKECLDLEVTDLGNILDGKGTLSFKKSDQDSPIDYNILSSGEKEVVDIILDIFLKRDVFKDSIFIIDEPELHLNTDIQRKLIIELEKLIPDNCQLWVATHSIGFLRALQDDLKDKGQVLDFSEKDYFSGAKTIKPIKPTRKNWQRIFQTALEDLTGLIAPKKIFYCEGKPESGDNKEEAGLDALIYDIIFEVEMGDTLFISSGGSDLVANASLALIVLNKAFKGVNLIILKDRDERTEKERELFLGESSTHRMLARREIENYLFDKEVLRHYCASKNVTFNEAEYNKVVNNVNEDDLKPVQQKIKESCFYKGTVGDFKIELAEFITPGTSVYRELKGCIFV